MSDHVDLDALADVLAGDREPAHLADCRDCRAALSELRDGSVVISAALAGLPAPALPPDIDSRLHEAIAAAPTPAPTASTSASASASASAVTTLPKREDTHRPASRWLGAAAAGVVLLAGAGYGISRLGGSGGGAESASSAAGTKSAAAPGVSVIRNSTGTDYTGRASLAAAVAHLLAGPAGRDSVVAGPAAPRAAAGTNQTRAPLDPLARLRGNAGLAECLLALLPPNDPSVRPLALDYAAYQGKPAMVVVLPSSLPNKLDVFVVGPGCSRANDSTLFYTSVDKP